MDLNALQSFYDGYSVNAYEIFGAHMTEDGTIFRLYAPNAKSVRLIGDFNGWNREADRLFKSDLGFWETKIGGLQEYARYKYVIETANGEFIEKADPYGFYNENRPDWGNKVVSLYHDWQDGEWMANRDRNFAKPMNIYEVHMGGFRHNWADQWLNYGEMIDVIIPYVKEMGYTHIELLPLNEHALDQSWGYQQFGYFSVTSRYGSPRQLMEFVDACHNNGIGVIMDIVIVHFLKDSFGLGNFDGTPLYESSDPNYAESQWGTHYFDFSKNVVKSFLLSSAGLWLDKYHMDGLRVDAVSNLIYFHGDKRKGENTEATQSKADVGEDGTVKTEVYIALRTAR
ncbi:MAG: hypothetical protein J5694_03020 [Erysipelotrichaceae bacterium]|nr:hypothetical protein [Erysipelotrichaceae bacterium]